MAAREKTTDFKDEFAFIKGQLRELGSKINLMSLTLHALEREMAIIKEETRENKEAINQNQKVIEALGEKINFVFT